MATIKINERQAALLKSLTNQSKKHYKITKEQYDRIFGDVIKESNLIKNGHNRVNNSFKSAFSGPDIKNLDEESFNINKPNSDIPVLDKKVMNRTSIHEDFVSPEFHQAVVNFISKIYNNPSQDGLDSFWIKHGVTWGDMMSYLTSLGLIIALPTGFELARKVGKKLLRPQDSIKAVETSLRVLVTNKSANRLKDPNGQQLMSNPDIDEASQTMNAIWPNNPYDERDAKVPLAKNRLYTAIAMNNEIAILKDAAGHLHVFYYDEINSSDFGDIAKIDLDAITNYVNNNINNLSTGVGVKDFESGVNLVKIDDQLKGELLSLYDKNRHISQVLTNINEMTSAGSSATGGSSGPFSAPMNSKIIKKKIPVVAEGPVAGSSADGGSSGPYDTNALPNISRDGTFKKNKKKGRAEVDTQWPHGKFVTKDGGGDSIDTIKQKKGKGSVISKNALLETIKEEAAMITELGLNDWKVIALLKHIDKADEMEFAKCLKIITGRDLDNVKMPKDLMIQTLREMGKEDVDYIYQQIIGSEIKSNFNGF